MAYYDTVFYCNAGDQSTTGHYAVTKWATGASIAAGALRRQNAAPTVGNERVFVCVVAGTTHATTEPTWVITRGGKTTDNTVTWQEVTGVAAVNGDATNTVTWTAAKAIGTPTLGTVIKRANAASYWICTTAGTMGASEPAWPNDTAGTTQTDGTTTWTCLGVVGNFTGGQAPHARLANVFTSTWFATGNTVYVGDNHAESQTTAITITPTGSATTIGRLLCHNHSGNYPPAGGDLTTGATVSTTAAAFITYNPGGVFYTYGVTFKAGVGASSSTGILLNSTVNTVGFYDNCSFWISSTQATNNIVQINASSGSNQCNWNNCTVKFANAANTLGIQSGSFTWQNTGQVLASGSVVPTALFTPQSSGTYTNLMLEALDLSQINTNIFGSNQTNEAGTRIIKDCKFNAAITVQQSGVTTLGLYEQVVRSDSGATGYKSARYSYDGTETTETSITRVGGAADPAGQAQSRKIVTTANSQWLRPFKAEPYAIWNPTTGANVTVTVYGTINAGALPNNDDIWIEIEYLGSSASPLGTFVTTNKSNVLAANAAVASDSSTWNGLPAYATFDGTPSAGVVMSNGNLTATHGVTNVSFGVASTLFKSSGKFYFEITENVTVVSGTGIGIILSTAIFNDASSGNNATEIALNAGAANIFSNNANTGKNLGGHAAGDIFGAAIDLTNRLAWFRRNAGNWNADPTANPATGVGGVTIAAGAFAPFVVFGSGGATDQFTGNFGQSAYANAAPSGFGNWVPTWSPFKLTAVLSSLQPGMAGYLEARVRAAKPSTTFYIDPQIVLS